MASNTDYLPDEITYGFVADRVLLAVGDTWRDGDRFPDGVPAQGTVRFSPERTILYTQQHPATVLPQDIECTIYHRDHPVAVNNGYEPELVGKLVDPAGHVGNVALIVGWYEVVYRLSTGTAQRFRFQVRPEHTNDDPLWLPEVAPLSPTPSERFVVNEQVYNDTKAARDEAEQFRDTTLTARDETIAARDLVLPARDQTLAARDQTLAHGITIDTSVGTTISVGDHIIHHESGWRDVTDHMRDGWSGNVYVWRNENTVFYNFRSVSRSEDASATVVGAVIGYTPLSTEEVIRAGLVTSDSPSILYRANITQYGATLVIPPEVTVDGVVSFPTQRPIPASLPGTPA